MNMNLVGLKICKSEIKNLIEDIERVFPQLDNQSKEYYRVIAKQILFFKFIFNTYSETYAAKVIISDFFNFMLDDIKDSTRYLYLNERSIIENYIRLILKDESYNTHITNQSFIDLKRENESILSDAEYGKIKNEYKISCSYIHGGYNLSNHLVDNFEDCLNGISTISQRSKRSRINQTLDLFKILNKLFIHNNKEVIETSFHRNKEALKYLLGSQYSYIN